MLKYSMLLILCCLFVFQLKAKKFKGQIITGIDTAQVTFKIPLSVETQEPNYSFLQHQIRYIDEHGKKQIVLPEDVDEVRFKFDNKTVRMLSRKNTLNLEVQSVVPGFIFIKLEIDGPLKLFTYFKNESMSGKASTPLKDQYSFEVEKYILQKEFEGLKRPKGMNFKYDMTHYFSNCPSLSQKIKSKELQSFEMIAIVNYYNSKCR